MESSANAAALGAAPKHTASSTTKPPSEACHDATRKHWVELSACAVYLLLGTPWGFYLDTAPISRGAHLATNSCIISLASTGLIILLMLSVLLDAIFCDNARPSHSARSLLWPILLSWCSLALWPPMQNHLLLGHSCLPYIHAVLVALLQSSFRSRLTWSVALAAVYACIIVPKVHQHATQQANTTSAASLHTAQPSPTPTTNCAFPQQPHGVESIAGSNRAEDDMVISGMLVLAALLGSPLLGSMAVAMHRQYTRVRQVAGHRSIVVAMLAAGQQPSPGTTNLEYIKDVQEVMHLDYLLDSGRTVALEAAMDQLPTGKSGSSPRKLGETADVRETGAASSTSLLHSSDTTVSLPHLEQLDKAAAQAARKAVRLAFQFIDIMSWFAISVGFLLALVNQQSVAMTQQQQQHSPACAVTSTTTPATTTSGASQSNMCSLESSAQAAVLQHPHMPLLLIMLCLLVACSCVGLLLLEPCITLWVSQAKESDVQHLGNTGMAMAMAGKACVMLLTPAVPSLQLTVCTGLLISALGLATAPQAKNWAFALGVVVPALIVVGTSNTAEARATTIPWATLLLLPAIMYHACQRWGMPSFSCSSTPTESRRQSYLETLDTTPSRKSTSVPATPDGRASAAAQHGGSRRAGQSGRASPKQGGASCGRAGSLELQPGGHATPQWGSTGSPWPAPQLIEPQPREGPRSQGGTTAAPADARKAHSHAKHRLFNRLQLVKQDVEQRRQQEGLFNTPRLDSQGQPGQATAPSSQSTAQKPSSLNSAGQSSSSPASKTASPFGSSLSIPSLNGATPTVSSLVHPSWVNPPRESQPAGDLLESLIKLSRTSGRVSTPEYGLSPVQDEAGSSSTADCEEGRDTSSSAPDLEYSKRNVKDQRRETMDRLVGWRQHAAAVQEDMYGLPGFVFGPLAAGTAPGVGSEVDLREGDVREGDARDSGRRQRGSGGGGGGGGSRGGGEPATGGVRSRCNSEGNKVGGPHSSGGGGGGGTGAGGSGSRLKKLVGSASSSGANGSRSRAADDEKRKPWRLHLQQLRAEVSAYDQRLKAAANMAAMHSNARTARAESGSRGPIFPHPAHQAAQGALPHIMHWPVSRAPSAHRHNVMNTATTSEPCHTQKHGSATSLTGSYMAGPSAWTSPTNLGSSGRSGQLPLASTATWTRYFPEDLPDEAVPTTGQLAWQQRLHNGRPATVPVAGLVKASDMTSSRSTSTRSLHKLPAAVGKFLLQGSSGSNSQSIYLGGTLADRLDESSSDQQDQSGSSAGIADQRIRFSSGLSVETMRPHFQAPLSGHSDSWSRGNRSENVFGPSRQWRVSSCTSDDVEPRANAISNEDTLQQQQATSSSSSGNFGHSRRHYMPMHARSVPTATAPMPVPVRAASTSKLLPPGAHHGQSFLDDEPSCSRDAVQGVSLAVQGVQGSLPLNIDWPSAAARPPAPHTTLSSSHSKHSGLMSIPEGASLGQEGGPWVTSADAASVLLPPCHTSLAGDRAQAAQEPAGRLAASHASARQATAHVPATGQVPAGQVPAGQATAHVPAGHVPAGQTTAHVPAGQVIHLSQSSHDEPFCVITMSSSWGSGTMGCITASGVPPLPAFQHMKQQLGMAVPAAEAVALGHQVKAGAGQGGSRSSRQVVWEQLGATAVPPPSELHVKMSEQGSYHTQDPALPSTATQLPGAAASSGQRSAVPTPAAVIGGAVSVASLLDPSPDRPQLNVSVTDTTSHELAALSTTGGSSGYDTKGTHQLDMLVDSSVGCAFQDRCDLRTQELLSSGRASAHENTQQMACEGGSSPGDVPHSTDVHRSSDGTNGRLFNAVAWLAELRQHPHAWPHGSLKPS